MTTRTILEKYELIAQLGSTSSQSEVWIGREIAQSTLIKIRRVPTRLARNKELLRAYHAPARRLNGISRPTLEQIYDANVDGDSYYIISELVRGEPLDVFAARVDGPLRVELALAILVDVCAALHVMHSISTNKGRAPVYHHTLTPASVMLTYLGEVKLVNGAVSKGEAMAAQSVPLSVLGYKSPEECMGGETDQLSNVFTLGIILWELLTGERLYGMRDDFDLMQAICSTPPLAPSKLNPSVPPFLDAVVNKALSKQPESRLSSVSQFAGALRNIQKTLPAVSSQEIARELFERFSDRVPSWQELFNAESQGDIGRIGHAISSLYVGHVARLSDMEDPALLRRTEEMIYSNDSLPLFEPEAPTLSKKLVSTSLSASGMAVQNSSPKPQVEELRGTLLGAPGKNKRNLQEQPTSPFIEAPDSLSFEQLSSELEQSVPNVSSTIHYEGEDHTREVKPDRDIMSRARQDYAEQRGEEGLGTTRLPLEELIPSASGHPDRTAEIPVTMAQTMTRSGSTNTLDVLQKRGQPSSGQDAAPTPEQGRRPHADPTYAQWFFGEDEVDEEDLYELPYDMDDLVGRPVRAGAVQSSREMLSEEPVVEVLRLVNGRVVESTTLRKRHVNYRPNQACVIVKLQGKKATVTRSEGTTGQITRKNAQHPESLGLQGGSFELGVGDTAHVHDGLFDYRIKFFFPPLSPARLPTEKRGRMLVGFALAGVFAAVLHVSAALFLVFFVGMSGMTVTVEEAPPPEEIFAEGKLEDLETPKPKPKPIPKPKPKPKPKPVKLTEQRVDPSEQRAIVPKSVQKRIAKRMEPRKSDESKADRLLGALASPNQGEGTTIRDVVSNIDAVQGGKATNSGAFRVAGTIAALEGGEGPNLATGGGGKIGNLAAGVKDGVGKVDKRQVDKGGKVRGKVRSVKALSKVKGGSLSKGDVYKEINRHMGKIRMCYERELLNNNTLGGKMTFEWTVKTNGSVKSVREKSSSMGSAKVSTCIKGVIQDMKFPKPKGGEVEVQFPFIFSAG